MNLGLDGRVALVTGGASGIGRAIVTALLEEGASVAIVDREEDASEHPPERIEWVRGDLTDPTVCKDAVARTVRRFGEVHALVNNAGVNDAVGLDAGPEAFMESLRRNLLHYYTMAHYALVHLKSSHGCIVNIGSKVSVTGQGGTSGYAASKGGVAALTREWALDLARHSVRVNAVVPAEVWTTMYSEWLNRLPDPLSERKQIEQHVPFERRFTTPEEIAATVLFLASSKSGHTTGQIVFVDGGYTHLDRRIP